MLEEFQDVHAGIHEFALGALAQVFVFVVSKLLLEVAYVEDDEIGPAGRSDPSR
jgi:hypothetical protein